MNPQMIVFGEDWGALPSSTQHIIRQLSDRYEVTWINSLGLRSPKASLHDFKRLCSKATKIVKQLTSKSSQTASLVPTKPLSKVVEPKYLPFPGNALARKINQRLLGSLLKTNAIENDGEQRPVIWISLPNAVDALYFLEQAGLQDAIVVYYCCDDFSSLAGVDHQAIGKLEVELMEKADMIVATNKLLLSKMPQSKTHLIGHGVDTSLFFRPSSRAEDLPNGKPIAGFYGSIADWLDVDLLKAVATKLPDWNFVFIGQVQIDVSALSEMDNIQFLGPRPHTQLPEYSQHWQVSMLPFVSNEQIEACNPLKLREYLAAGKPVVSTDFTVAREYGEFITIAQDAESYAQALKDTLLEKPVMWALRRRRVAGESWQAVADKIATLIEAA